jgi:uroporphyrinogen-III decarboxylase
MDTIYFDNNATTRVAPEVRDAMLPYFCDFYGNPSSMHAFGGNVSKVLARAREEAAAFVNATPDEIEREVDRVRSILGPNIVISPSHERILPNVPVENLLAMARAAKK